VKCILSATVLGCGFKILKPELTLVVGKKQKDSNQTPERVPMLFPNKRGFHSRSLKDDLLREDLWEKWKESNHAF